MREFSPGLLALLVLAFVFVDVHAQDQFTSTKGHPHDVLAFSTNALAEEPVSLPLLPLPLGDRRWPAFLSAQRPAGVITLGSLSGSATAGQGPTFSPIPGAPLTLRRAGNVVATTTTDAQGQFSIPDLPRGRYLLELGPPGGVLASIEAHVADGVESRELFFLDVRTNQFFAFKPAVAIGSTDPQLDVNGDGIVNLDDLEYVEACLGMDPLQVLACAPADVDGDGTVDGTDIALVKANFDQYIGGVPGLYGAAISRGGSQLIAGDFLLTSNSGGLTEVMVDRDPSNPRQVLLSVVSDRGTASPPPPLVGDLSFTEDSVDPTTATVNLDTGRFTTGRMTLRVSGPGGMENAFVEGNIVAGQMVFAPQGFNLYHAFVTGTLPPDFPVFAGAVYSLIHCEPNKPDDNCINNKQTVDTTLHPECTLGFQCIVERSGCKLNGRQGACKTVDTGAAGTCDCRCR